MNKLYVISMLLLLSACASRKELVYRSNDIKPSWSTAYVFSR